MNSDGLTNKQFVTIALIIVLCGIAILGHDYFMAKRAGVYEDMSIFFTNLDKLSLGAFAYITYNGREYKYELIRIHKDKQDDGGIDLYRHSSKKHLTLVTCSRPDFHTYYLVLTFELVTEYNI